MATSASVSSFMIRPRGRFLPRASSSRQAASAFSRPSASALPRLDLDPFPGQRRIVDIIGRIGEPLHLLVEPGAAPGRPQPLEHLREELGEMGDVADRIVDLALVERPARPVGEARALVELACRAGSRPDSGIADLLAQPERHRRDLGVEQGMGRAAGQVEDDLDILAAGVEDLQHMLVVDQQVEQGREVDAPRPWDRSPPPPRSFADLDQAQLRPVGVLAHELGVDRDEVGLWASRSQSFARVSVSVISGWICIWRPS